MGGEKSPRDLFPGPVGWGKYRGMDRRLAGSDLVVGGLRLRCLGIRRGLCKYLWGKGSPRGINWVGREWGGMPPRSKCSVMDIANVPQEHRGRGGVPLDRNHGELTIRREGLGGLVAGGERFLKGSMELKLHARGVLVGHPQGGRGWTNTPGTSKM